MDVLLHPAKAEPYGMVIAEAMAASVPVVVSDACGAAAQIVEDSGSVLQLESPLSVWVDAVEDQLRRAQPVPGYVRGWEKVAQEFIEIYEQKSNNK
jgi:UDP-glucose:(heptosyl)LPS alpha-1,3-glucosyltransferase